MMISVNQFFFKVYHFFIACFEHYRNSFEKKKSSNKIIVSIFFSTVTTLHVLILKCRHLINIFTFFFSISSYSPLHLKVLIYNCKQRTNNKKRSKAKEKKKTILSMSCHEDHFGPKCNQYFFV